METLVHSDITENEIICGLDQYKMMGARFISGDSKCVEM